MKNQTFARLLSLGLCCSLTTAAVAQVGSIGLVSLNNGGGQGNSASGISGRGACPSADGRFVAFASNANNLVAGDGNGFADIFVRDNVAGTTVRVSVSSAGGQGNGASGSPWMSDNGQFIVFQSDADNLVPADFNGMTDIFVHDRSTGNTTKVSTGFAVPQANGASVDPHMSRTGRFVTFRSAASNMVAGDANAADDIFVTDLVAGTTKIVSVSTGGAQTPMDSFAPSVSADGQFIAFQTQGILAPGDPNGLTDIYVRNMGLGVTTPISVAPGGGPTGNGPSESAIISDDGNAVAFMSAASNLVLLDANGRPDIFVFYPATGRVQMVSRVAVATGANGPSFAPGISSDGRFISFTSEATNLHPAAINGQADIFFADMIKDTIIPASLSFAGVEGNADSRDARVTGNGQFVAFNSFANNLVADGNGQWDVFLKYIRSPKTTIHGRVSFQDTSAMPSLYSLDAELRTPAGALVASFPNLPIGDDGSYWFDTTQVGNFKVIVKAGTFLSEMETVSLTADGSRLLSWSMRNGDSVDDNVVDLSDYTAIALAFNALLDSDPATAGNQPSANWNPRADLNKDGVVDLTDYTIIAVNFNQLGEV